LEQSKNFLEHGRWRLEDLLDDRECFKESAREEVENRLKGDHANHVTDAVAHVVLARIAQQDLAGLLRNHGPSGSAGVEDSLPHLA